MKKSKIEELIESYHADVNCEPLIAQVPYQKGWIKKFFGFETKGGIEFLEAFLESEAVSQLDSEDEIDGDNLLTLLKIMYQRENRIYKTRRSYENYPEKSINRIYNRLYHLLLLDVTILDDIGLQTPYSYELHQLLFLRATNKALAEIEQRAAEQDNPEKANLLYLELGLSLIFSKPISHTFDIEEDLDLQGITRHIKKLQFNEQFVHIEFSFLKGELHEAKFLRAKIQCKNIDEGLEWLELASGKGESNASLHLAAFYAQRGNYRFVNEEVDSDKTVEFLTLARDQGSNLAADVLERGLNFGMVSLHSLKGPSCN